ncbi:MAG: response regulator transcription factor [Geminicoccaceae bacterium]|nr:response regulator transcription factor [Solirubrobacterales bacterium]MCE3246367.1 response regulator transcription factor [Geminicoccaceae bacterium]
MIAADRVLVVDDEPMVRDVLARYLARDGFEVETVGDGEAALAAFEAVRPDLILLDLMLPRVDGFEVFRRLRAAGVASPVIMLTARGEVTDRIVGLEIGADDYVSKPFSPKEVVARVRAVLRRSRAAVDGEGADPLRFGELEIDARTREVWAGGELVQLTPKEFDLLHLLASRPRTVFSRYRLLDELWDVAFQGDPATVTVHVRRIREKIEGDPSQPRHLITVWGAGYRFEP